MIGPVGGSKPHSGTAPAAATGGQVARPKGGGSVLDRQEKSVLFERPKPNVIELAQADARAAERQVQQGLADTWKSAHYTPKAIADVAKAAEARLGEQEGGGTGAQTDAAPAEMNISHSQGPVGPAENDCGIAYNGLGIGHSQGPTGPAVIDPRGSAE
ncbi:MAG: hypothetical protein AB1714_15730 [Acidobacteriota bacterium]